MHLNSVPEWEKVEKSVEYLKEKGVQIDDIKLFDEILNLSKYVSHQATKENTDQPIHKKWVMFFSSCNISCAVELLRVAQFFFAIPAHNANVERVFSIINAQWSKERNRLTIDSVRMLTAVKVNLSMTCVEFYDYISKHKDLLKKLVL